MKARFAGALIAIVAAGCCASGAEQARGRFPAGGDSSGDIGRGDVTP